MSEGKRTPGPFQLEAMGCVYRHDRFELRLSHMLDNAECAELVDLLNKGAHFDVMLKALKLAQADYASAASTARAAADAARSHAERMRYRERLDQLENTAKRFAEVIAQAEESRDAE